MVVLRRSPPTGLSRAFACISIVQSLNPMAPRIITLFQTDAGEDAINTGGVTFDVFVKTLNYFHSRTPLHVKLEKLFRAYDVDGDGVISERDLQQILKYYTGPHLSEATSRVLVRKCMAHALTRCKGEKGEKESGPGGAKGKRNSSSDATTGESQGLTLEDFSRVVSLDGLDALHIPIQS